jgi:hypothetical protein
METLAIVGAVAAIAGTAMSAMGSIQQGQAQKQAADYNAQVANQNARAALDVSTQQQEEARRQGDLALGEATASIGQAGVGYGGSAAEVMRQNYINDSLNQLNIRYSGEAQAQGFRQQADLLKYEGSQAQTAGYLGAGTALLSGTAGYLGSPRGMANVASMGKTFGIGTP